VPGPIRPALLFAGGWIAWTFSSTLCSIALVSYQQATCSGLRAGRRRAALDQLGHAAAGRPGRRRAGQRHRRARHALGKLAIASVAVLVGVRMVEQAKRAGLLKAVGGTTRLVAAVLLAENLLPAVAATVTGLIVGWFAAPRWSARACPCWVPPTRRR